MKEYQDWNGFDFKPADSNLIYPQRLLDILKPPASIFEIGCDKGGLGFDLLSKGYNMVCVDINKSAVEYASKLKEKIGTDKIKFFTADMCEDESWDDIEAENIEAVMLIKVLTVLPRNEQRNKLLQNIRNNLKKGTLVYIYDFMLNENNPAYAGRYKEGYKIFNEMGTFDVKDQKGEHMYYAHHHSEKEIDSLSALFEKIELEYKETISYHGNRADTFEFIGKI